MGLNTVQTGIPGVVARVEVAGGDNLGDAGADGVVAGEGRVRCSCDGVNRLDSLEEL